MTYRKRSGSSANALAANNVLGSGWSCSQSKELTWRTKARAMNTAQLLSPNLPILHRRHDSGGATFGTAARPMLLLACEASACACAMF